MAYLWLKTFHIVGVVVWFAGLFYLVRLFVYHREAAEKTTEEKRILSEQLSIMESRLLNIITTPGMILTLGTASGLLYVSPQWLTQGWLHIKIALVASLVGYHFLCIRVMKSLQAGELKWSPKSLRALNEFPTLILVSVVMCLFNTYEFSLQTSSSWILTQA